MGRVLLGFKTEGEGRMGTRNCSSRSYFYIWEAYKSTSDLSGRCTREGNT